MEVRDWIAIITGTIPAIAFLIALRFAIDGQSRSLDALKESHKVTIEIMDKRLDKTGERIEALVETIHEMDVRLEKVAYATGLESRVPKIPKS